MRISDWSSDVCSSDLIGRTLDEFMREEARSAGNGLARLSPRGATAERGEGTWAYVPLEEIAPGMVLLIAAGERVPVDGRVVSGTSDLDCALVTGESAPRAVTPGRSEEHTSELQSLMSTSYHVL